MNELFLYSIPYAKRSIHIRILVCELFLDMESLAVELVQEIGLYLDPKTYHSLRKSYNTHLPFVQRVLPSFFGYPKVQELLVKHKYRRKELKTLFQISEVNQELIKKFLDCNQFSLLIPFARQVLEIDPNFYHSSKLSCAIENHQFLYITRMFQIATCSADLSKLEYLY